MVVGFYIVMRLKAEQPADYGHEELEAAETDGTFEKLVKHEVLGLRRERDKLLASLGGIKEMNRLPDALFACVGGGSMPLGFFRPSLRTRR